MMQRFRNSPTRRGFLAGVGGLSATALLASCSDSVPATTTSTTVTPDIPDNDILNFALNLEYLEAEFYLRAATGTGIPTANGGGASIAGGSVIPSLTAAQAGYVNAIAQDELNHVIYLRAAISGNGGTPVAEPTIDFTDAFNVLASAAGIASTFNPFSSYNNFLIGAFVFEDVGVTAYTGAAPLISSTAILSAAAGIQATESYHAAEIRTSILATGSSTLLTYANQISTLRGTLGGGNETPLSATSVVASSVANAIAFGRTTSQVLHIVYGTGGGAGIKGGAFFPNGLNGSISVTSA